MHRLFVAIVPPREIRLQLLAMMGGIGGARWQTEEQLHITLRFIGEVDRHRAEDIALELSAVRQPAFELSLGEIGSFARRGRVETIWAGVKPHEPLKMLHNKVDLACVRAGLEPERRSYHPHITLARLKASAGPIDGFMIGAAAPHGARFGVKEFALMESSLNPAGADYAMVERYALGA